jgi:hypothetical protein
MTRTCKHCGLEKDLVEFYGNYKLNGVRKVCITCKDPSRKHWYYWHKYKLDPETLAQLGTSCSICGSTDKLVVDHDHISGLIRGKLCVRCNSGLGMFTDSVEKLQKAISYLQTPREPIGMVCERLK